MMVGFSTKWHWPILIEGIWYYCNDALAPSQAAQKKDGTQSTKEGCRAPIVMTDCARLPGDWIACGGTRRFWLDPGRCPIAQPETRAIGPGPHWWYGSFSTLRQAVS